MNLPDQAPAPPAPVLPPTTEELRQRALARSAQRGDQVARRRLAWRWTVWGLRLLLLWGGGAALLLAGALWLWQQRQGPAVNVQAARLPPAGAAVSATASAPAAFSSAVPASQAATPAVQPLPDGGPAASSAHGESKP